MSVFKHSELCLLETGVSAGFTPLANFDLIWMLGLGEKHDFLDRCQILSNLPASQLVNSPLASIFFHSKHASLPHSPLFFSGNNAHELAAAAQRHPQVSRWVVKPSAGSYGRGVAKTNSQDELLQQLAKATAGGKYCIVQAYVDEIVDGETRSLLVNGEIIGSYLRIPEKDFLANLSQGGRARSTVLDTQQTAQVIEIGNFLAKKGIRFASVDMAFPWLIEVNIANPGGLATLASLEADLHPNIEERLVRGLRGMLGWRTGD